MNLQTDLYIVIILLSLTLSFSLQNSEYPTTRLSKSDYKNVGNNLKGRVLDITLFGAIPNDQSKNLTNMEAINRALSLAQPGDTLLIPQGNVFYTVGGILGNKISDLTIQFDGTLYATFDLKNWPKQNQYNPFLLFQDSHRITFTSSVQGGGIINGNGQPWWNHVILGTLPGGDTRPMFVWFVKSTDLLVENLTLINSPFWTLTFGDCARVEARNIDVIVDRNYQRTLKYEIAQLQGASLFMLHQLKKSVEQTLSDVDSVLRTKIVNALKSNQVDEHKKEILKTIESKQHEIKKKSWILQPWDLNTDGIDPSGTDFYIHDCNIHNDDDSIAVQPNSRGSKYSACSQNILLENLVLIGFGASIGSVPPSTQRNCVNNVTFFNISMPNTGKGIYIKSNPSCQGEPNKTSQISNIKYQNVVITKPVWWPIWIGPQQQHQPHEKLGQKCALDYPISPHCPTQGCTDFYNITLKNVLIKDSLISPGVMFGNSTNPMQNVIFDNVVAEKSGRIPFFSKKWPFRGTYKCEYVNGVITNSNPVPSNCFKQNQ